MNQDCILEEQVAACSRQQIFCIPAKAGLLARSYGQYPNQPIAENKRFQKKVNASVLLFMSIQEIPYLLKLFFAGFVIAQGLHDQLGRRAGKQRVDHFI